jgi:gliding motility-associated-like protein
MPFLRSLVLLFGVCAAAAVPGMAPQGFDFSGTTNRIITPNGDGFNDGVTFHFANPRDSTGSIRIYDLHGRELLSLPISLGDTSETWDARANGRIVDSGLYIYVLNIERRTYSGAVLVVR